MRTRLKLAFALLTVLGLAALPALAIDPGACCVQSTSRLETLLNPQRGSDEKFFTTAGGPPNVLFIVDTSGSMEAWPQAWPSAQGCNHSSFAGAGYNPATDYQGFISGMTGPAGNKTPTYDDKWFNDERVYDAEGSHDSNTNSPDIGHNFSSSGGPGGVSWAGVGATAAARLDSAMTLACTSKTLTNIPACRTCLQTKGYYVQDANNRLATGNFLEFYSPRDVSVKMVLSQLLFEVREIRLGIMTFSNWGGSCYANSGHNRICLWEALGPNCNQLYPLDTSAVENQRNSILGGLSRNDAFDARTPLASTLYLAGYHFRSRAPDGYDALFAGSFPGNTSLDEPTSANQKSICTACSFNAVVILTDGEPFDESINTFPAEIDGYSSMTAGLCPAGTGACDSKLDEVAAFLWNNDVRADLGGQQRVATYTIGFGTNANANQLLTSTARVGGGKHYPANGSSAIKQALLDILEDIQSRNNSFSSAAVAAVQTGSSATPALLPRMMPRKGQPWEGYLWRFEQFNEFVEDRDLNGDSDKEDVFIIEGTADAGVSASNIVTEAIDGTFVKQGSATAATPFWEANARLRQNLGSNVSTRKVWTVVDKAPTGGDGVFNVDDADGGVGTGLRRVALGSSTDDLRMAEYFGLRGTSYCPSGAGNGSLINRWGLTLSGAQTAAGFSLPGLPTQADYDRLCVRLVILWVQGADLFDSDGDGNRTEARENVLGDIFHSSPVIVDSPVEPFLCDLGLSTQCARTLYSENLAGLTPTPQPPQSVASPVCGITTLPPYEAYAFEQRRRQKLVLVGANDGMVHAFVSGTFVGESCVGGRALPTFDTGNGDEAWAFIPPDLLPKIPDTILAHEYMVDGDIMVRDIWADDNADGVKQKNEFHTMAYVSEGRGGKHYIALEMLYQSSGAALDRPGFRWIFPQPCTEEAATFGKTFFSLSPKPPPVGPVLIDDASLPASSRIANATPVARLGSDTHERWVVALSGGWSPGLEKGRGIYVVDAYDGSINGRRDNLWWKFEFKPGANGFEQPARQLTHSVSAPVALIDYGPNDQSVQDGFFDTALFGDTGGQLWVARMHAPGRVSGTDNLIHNWAAARSFQMDRDGLPGAATSTALADGGTEPPDVNATSYANKHPFYYLPSAAIEPGNGKLRVFAGTGNRYAVLESGPGMCRFDNPVACSKSRCSDVKVESRFEDGIVDVDEMETHWKSRRFEHGRLQKSLNVQPTAALSASNACGSTGSVRVRASNSSFNVGTCDYSSGADPTPGQINELQYECGLDSSGNSFTCTRTGPLARNGGLNDLLDLASVDTTNLGNNRFVGFWAYGAGRTFVESPDGGQTPQTYDDLRLSDRSTGNPASGDLVNVTSVGCDGTGSCDGGASLSDYGWFLDYAQLPQKTATGAAVIASCVLWSDLSPTGGDGGVCGASVTPSSRIFQADFITGQPNCAYGFLAADGGAFSRFQSRTVVAPPPEPATVVQVSTTGEIRYSAMIVEPGKGQATTVNVSGGQDVLQLVYELPVSRSLHLCRHADGGCSTSP